MAKQLLKAPLQIRVSALHTQEAKIEIQNAIIGLQRWAEQVSRVVNNLVSNIPIDSTASDVPGIVSDFNDLLAELRGLSVQ